MTQSERFYSTYRIYQKKAKEELETQEHMERRMQAVLSLKNNITSNRVQVLVHRSVVKQLID